MKWTKEDKERLARIACNRIGAKFIGLIEDEWTDYVVFIHWSDAILARPIFHNGMEESKLIDGLTASLTSYLRSQADESARNLVLFLSKALEKTG